MPCIKVLIVLFFLVFIGIPSVHASAVVAKQQQQGQMMQAAKQKAYVQQMSASLAGVWQQMGVSSQIWAQIDDDMAKVLTVKRFISYYTNQGVAIRKPAEHYVAMINGLADQNPDLLRSPFKAVIKLVAIIEYDFDNGTDKDQMALNALGQATYEANKRRLGLP